MSPKKTALGKSPWTRRASGAVAIALLVAVPALGLTTLGPNVRAAWDVAKDGLSAAPAGAVSANPLTFDAPATTSLRLRPAGGAGNEPTPQAGVVAAREDAIVLKDWHFTASGFR